MNLPLTKIYVLFHRLYDFSKKKSDQKLVKIVKTDVPPGILPTSHSAILYDLKVFGNHCPDDEIYSKYPDLQKSVRHILFIPLTKSTENRNLARVIKYVSELFFHC